MNAVIPIHRQLIRRESMTTANQRLAPSPTKRDLNRGVRWLSKVLGTMSRIEQVRFMAELENLFEAAGA